jgi:hypothetical protein
MNSPTLFARLASIDRTALCTSFYITVEQTLLGFVCLKTSLANGLCTFKLTGFALLRAREAFWIAASARGSVGLSCIWVVIPSFYIIACVVSSRGRVAVVLKICPNRVNLSIIGQTDET